jgi:hypothetical protein
MTLTRNTPAPPHRFANDFARAKSQRETRRYLLSLFSLSLRRAGSTTFAEGDAGEARRVAQRSGEGAAGPTRPSPPTSSAPADEGRR